MNTFANITSIDNATDNSHRWSFCYLHGMAEFVESQANGDIFVADVAKPDVGNYLVSVDGQPALAVIKDADGAIVGRVALLSDTYALAHCLTGDWE